MDSTVLNADKSLPEVALVLHCFEAQHSRNINCYIVARNTKSSDNIGDN